MISLAEEPALILSPAALTEFWRKADLMDHDKNKLLNGEEITTYFKFHAFAEAQKVFSNATAEQRQRRLETFFSPALQKRAKLGQGKHDRGEAVVIADAPINDLDSRGINRHFPLRVKGISVLHRVIREGETWDVSVQRDIWSVDEMEELYVIVNVGTLVLEKGAKIVIRGNVFSLLCQQLISEDPSGYQIGILPTPYSVDFGRGPHNGTHGRDGNSGHNGVNGQPGELQYGTLGAWVPDQSTGKLHGALGGDGGDGENGVKGRNGGMCKLAEITIRQLSGRLHLFSQAGAGGDGGNGGNGGDGGDGGNGAPGLKGFNNQIPGGNGGHGGQGGNGGNGGNAGHGGLASNIYLNLPNEALAHVSMAACDSVGGIGGAGGAVGHAGKGGRITLEADSNLNGRAGEDGRDGKPGKRGHNGRGRPAADLYLNDLPYKKI